ncbi:MAG: ArsR/SmtB family transcription factor [Bryobacteraceae bacterium]
MNPDSQEDPVPRYANVFAALGTEARLRILRLLLASHPKGLFAGEIQAALGIPASTLSHHLEKLKNEGLVRVRRSGTFLRYTADTDTLREVVTFLYSECCGRARETMLGDITQLCAPPPQAE